MSRPQPPSALLDVGQPDLFLPGPDLWDWVAASYLEPAGPLANEDHAHLRSARLAFLWTNAPYRKAGRAVVGQAEFLGGSGGGSNRWAAGRRAQQIREWFGDEEPDFLITLDALHADTCTDAEFCALVDHELYHCAQADDEFGMPKFSRDTGEPVFCLRGHDVEEFVGVVRRFGIEAAGQPAVDLVVAAASPPSVGVARLAHACGTCALRAVA